MLNLLEAFDGARWLSSDTCREFALFVARGRTLLRFSARDTFEVESKVESAS
jgi:hypothetical protein